MFPLGQEPGARKPESLEPRSCRYLHCELYPAQRDGLNTDFSDDFRKVRNLVGSIGLLIVTLRLIATPFVRKKATWSSASTPSAMSIFGKYRSKRPRGTGRSRPDSLPWSALERGLTSQTRGTWRVDSCFSTASLSITDHTESIFPLPR